jgi:Protein of unknown function (DUF3088)
MAKSTLFLLKPGFHDDKGGPFFCPDCAAVEGFLKCAPEVERRLDVRRIDFPRPRREIIDLLGSDHQGCPVLVLDQGAALPADAKRSAETGRLFVSGSLEICEYLGRTFGAVRPHP